MVDSNITIKTNCVMEYRRYVPSGYIAIPYCDLHFAGENSRQYSSEWDKIQYGKFDSRQSKIDELENENKILDELIEKSMKAISEIKGKRTLFKRYKEEIQKEQEYMNELIRRKGINCGRIKLESDDRFYSAPEKIDKAHHFLERNGFFIMSSSTEDAYNLSIKEIWVKEN